MSNKTQIEALNELQHYGFIKKENNARIDGGITRSGHSLANGIWEVNLSI